MNRCEIYCNRVIVSEDVDRTTNATEGAFLLSARTANFVSKDWSLDCLRCARIREGVMFLPRTCRGCLRVRDGRLAGLQTGAILHRSFAVQNSILAMSQQLSSRPQPQRQVKSLDPWLHDCYSILSVPALDKYLPGLPVGLVRPERKLRQWSRTQSDGNFLSFVIVFLDVPNSALLQHELSLEVPINELLQHGLSAHNLRTL